MRVAYWCLPVLLLYGMGFCSADDQIVDLDEAALLKLFDAKDLVSIASGYKQPLFKAPSVATVITAEDIKVMGATDLDEVLETVPGLHVSYNFNGYAPIYTMRGVYAPYNSQVLVMINGIPITNLFVNDRGRVWGGMPVQAIARVEVVRGPGSALYGADAVAGAINIITKAKQDINGTELGGRVGSFDTYDGWMLHGDTWAGFDVAATMEYHDTQGPEGTIDIDAQTPFDKLYGTRASHAPGQVVLPRRNVDARLDLSREHWRLRAGLQSRQNNGNGLSSTQALDPYGRRSSERWNTDLTYDNPQFAEDWGVQAQLSYFDVAQDYDENSRLFPAGALLPIGLNGQLTSPRDPQKTLIAFPDGYIGNSVMHERQARLHLSAMYTGLKQHTVRMGGGFNYGTLFDAGGTRNYGINPWTGLASPQAPNITPMLDITGTTGNFISNTDRKIFFGFVQDEWRFAKQWTLTAGARYDNYSDFGNTFNPRGALVWDTRDDLTTKLMYGSAFRAPSFSALYLKNTPASTGNPDLKPETMDTVELAFDYRPLNKLRLSLNIFHYWWKDLILLRPDAGKPTYSAQNVGLQTSYGTELEAEWKAADTLKLLGNYSFQKSQDEALNHDAGYAPHHQVYLRANWEFLPDWSFTPQAKWIIGRGRTDKDTRPAVADYTWVDFTLRRQHIAQHWEVAFSVRNVLDANAREPGLMGNTSAAIPNDLPLPGRSFFGEVRVNF